MDSEEKKYSMPAVSKDTYNAKMYEMEDLDYEVMKTDGISNMYGENGNMKMMSSKSKLKVISSCKSILYL